MIRPWAADLAGLTLLAVAVALFFWRLWAPNPADRVAFPIGDFTDQYYPLRRFVAGSLAEGRLPFWNPYIYGGQPGLADPQAAALYPPAVLNALFWGRDFPLIALEFEVVAHILLGGWGAYLFVRAALRLGVVPALVAAIVFAFGGYLTGFPIDQITILESAVWLPWLLLLLHVAAEAPSLRRRIAWAAPAAIVLALVILAGHPQTALYVTYLAAGYAVLRLVVAQPEGASSTHLKKRVLNTAALLVVFPLGAGLAAAQIYPTLAFIEESSRSALNYEFARPGLKWDEILTLLLPNLVGNSPLYIGLAPLFLAPLGLMGRGARVQKRFWVLVAIIALLLALGSNAALFDLLYLGLPGLSNIRSQERVLLLFGWSAALLASWGAGYLLQAGEDRTARIRVRRYARQSAAFIPVVILPLLLLWGVRVLALSQVSLNLGVFDALLGRYSFFVVVFLLLWALLAWYAGRTKGRVQLTGALLLLLLLFDLFTINRGGYVGQPPGRVFDRPAAVLEALRTWHAVAPARIALVGDLPFKPNDGMVWDLPFLTGNEPMRLERSFDFLSKIEAWRQFQLLNVGYVIADRDLAAESPVLYEPLASGEGVYLVRLRRAPSYAWIVAQSETPVDDRDVIRARLNDPSFDSATTVVLGERDFELAEAVIRGEGVVEAHAPGYAQIMVDVPSAALLVTAEPHTDGWKATVDGRPIETERANLINTAIPVPPGRHVVTLRYEQEGWREGLVISVLSFGALLGMLAWGWSGVRSGQI